MPHYTTLQKFAVRLKLKAIERALAAVAASATGDGMVVAIDTATQIILTSSSGPGADADNLGSLMDKLRGLDIDAVVADCGYGSETNRRFIVREIGAEAHIPVRCAQTHAVQQHGLLRRRQLAVFDAAVYARRSLSETTHPTEKRTMDGLAYNARRAVAFKRGWTLQGFFPLGH